MKQTSAWIKTGLALWLGGGLLLSANANAQSAASQGEYVARAADCAACHTVKDGGKPYAGGYAIQSPLGAIYSTNITPSKTVGIGNWTEAQFARAVRAGVSADGHRLYPAMPYDDYSGMSDADVQALYTYLTTQVKAVDDPPQQVTQLGFPYNMRSLMAAWDMLFVKTSTTADATQDPQSRGRYLVDVLGHCGSCHTPRNLMMATEKGSYLAGADVGGWFAPNITSDTVAGIGGWSNDELVTFFKEGHTPGKAQAAGGMGEAVEHSLRYLSDSDLHAMAAYLKSVPPKSVPGQVKPDYAYGDAPAKAYDFDDPQSLKTLREADAATPIGDALLASRTYTDVPKVSNGARLFADACSSCHQPNGSGTADHYYPSLFHNTATGATTANNLVMTILHGVDRTGADGPTYMPAFGSDLTDAQVAAVATYVTTQFGNPALHVTADDVAQLRAGGPAPALKTLMPCLLGGALVVLVLLCVLAITQLRRKPRRR